MTTETKKYATITVGQLKKLIEDCDNDQEIRVWVECRQQDAMLLEGRRLIGVMDDPNDKYVCLVAGYYREEDGVE